MSTPPITSIHHHWQRSIHQHRCVTLETMYGCALIVTLIQHDCCSNPEVAGQRGSVEVADKVASPAGTLRGVQTSPARPKIYDLRAGCRFARRASADDGPGGRSKDRQIYVRQAGRPTGQRPVRRGTRCAVGGRISLPGRGDGGGRTGGDIPSPDVHRSPRRWTGAVVSTATS